MCTWCNLFETRVFLVPSTLITPLNQTHVFFFHMPLNKFKSSKETTWHCDLERDCIPAYFSFKRWKSHELVCNANVAICSWFDIRISLKDPKVIKYKSFEMNKTQTYRTSYSYSGWRSTLVCNDSFSPMVECSWFDIRISLKDPKVIKYKSFEMNKTQTYRTSYSYSGWRSTLVCNDSFSPMVEWVHRCMKLGSSGKLMHMHMNNGPNDTFQTMCIIIVIIIIITIIKVSMSQALPCPARLWTLQKPSMSPHIAARSKHILNSLEYVVPWHFHTCILLFWYFI